MLSTGVGGQGLARPPARCLQRERRPPDRNGVVPVASSTNRIRSGGKVERRATVGEVNRPAPPRPHNGRTVLPPSVSATRWESPASDPMSNIYATHKRTPDNVASCWDVTRRVVPRTSTLWEALGRRRGEAAPLPDHVLRVMCLRGRAKERRQVCAGCDGVTSRSPPTQLASRRKPSLCRTGYQLLVTCPSLAEDGSTVAIVSLAQAANEDATATIVVLDDGV